MSKIRDTEIFTNISTDKLYIDNQDNSIVTLGPDINIECNTLRCDKIKQTISSTDYYTMVPLDESIYIGYAVAPSTDYYSASSTVVSYGFSKIDSKAYNPVLIIGEGSAGPASVGWQNKYSNPDGTIFVTNTLEIGSSENPNVGVKDTTAYTESTHTLPIQINGQLLKLLLIIDP